MYYKMRWQPLMISHWHSYHLAHRITFLSKLFLLLKKIMLFISVKVVRISFSCSDRVSSFCYGYLVSKSMLLPFLGLVNNRTH